MPVQNPRTKLLVAVLASSALSGCSLLVGPAPVGATYRPEIEKLEESAAKDWTNFHSLEEADRRLGGMVSWLDQSARVKEATRQAAADVTTTGLIVSAVAAAAGDLRTARNGAGVAALVGVGEDRYQLVVQRTNMITAAKAFQCVREAIYGLHSSDLEIPFLPQTVGGNEQAKEFEDVAKLNDIRWDAVRLVSSTTFEIRAALEEAQAQIEIKRPDVDKIRDSVSQETKSRQATDVTRQNPFVRGRAANFADVEKQVLADVGYPDPQDIRWNDVPFLIQKLNSARSAADERRRTLISVSEQAHKELQKAEALEKTAELEYASETDSTKKASKKRAKLEAESGKNAAQAIFENLKANLASVETDKANIETTIQSLKQLAADTVQTIGVDESRTSYIAARIRALPDRLRTCRAMMPAS
jgi:hypothetical protein